MGTKYRGKPADVRALDALIKLVRAANAVSGRLDRKLAAHELTEGQFGVLEALYHLGPLCQRELGAKLLTSGGNVTMIVDNLEKRALVKRSRDQADRRYVSVHLTAAGRRLIAEIFPQHVAAVTALFATLEPAEQERLGELCKRLGLGAMT